uniref:Uncharacterized protein n=1 Tax=Ignisphaera aggregans TaxID=334771 RepID=A0A7J3I636_9CREN
MSTLGFTDLGAPFIDVHVIGLHHKPASWMGSSSHGNTTYIKPYKPIRKLKQLHKVLDGGELWVEVTLNATTMKPELR